MVYLTRTCQVLCTVHYNNLANRTKNWYVNNKPTSVVVDATPYVGKCDVLYDGLHEKAFLLSILKIRLLLVSGHTLSWQKQ